MIIEIKKYEFNSDLNGFVVELKDGRVAYVQAEKNTNRLHADFNTYDLCIESSIDANESVLEDSEEIIEALKELALKEVEDFLESLED